MYKMLLLLLLAGCASAPAAKGPPEVPMHFVSGLVLTNCGVVIAAELVTNNGHLIFWTQRDANPDEWEAAIQKENELGDKSDTVDLAPGCMRA